jgi:microcystin-dependent protein
MAQPYVGEIRIFAGNFAPAGWMFCDGSVMPIYEYETLFQLIGTTYGGDGQSTFALPDLRGRFPMHMDAQHGTSYPIGGQGGVETVTVNAEQIPAHSHVPVGATSGGTSASPTARVWSSWPDTPYSTTGVGTVQLNPGSVQLAGGSQPHENRPPYLAVSMIISLFGIFPFPS